MNTKGPGLELVISPTSPSPSRCDRPREDMHRIMDAERDATLAYLDDLTRRLGGRRGQAAARTRIEGLIYATARHATSRAGDAGPHDHVLLANLVRMNGVAEGSIPTTGWVAGEHAVAPAALVALGV